jgi:hypothetical protein
MPLRLMYILRLLFVVKCFKVMAWLRFQLVGGRIKNQVLPFFC